MPSQDNKESMPIAVHRSFYGTGEMSASPGQKVVLGFSMAAQFAYPPHRTLVAAVLWSPLHDRGIAV